MDYALAGFKCLVPRQKETGAMWLSGQKKNNAGQRYAAENNNYNLRVIDLATYV